MRNNFEKLFLFIFPTLVISISAEVVNQILVKKSISGFLHTAIAYFVFLIILFVVKKGFNKIFKNNFWNALVWYIVLGIFGLAIEWGLLGNAGVAWYGHLAMFTFWGSFGIVPVMSSEYSMKEDLKKIFYKYLVIWIFLYILLGVLVNPGLGLLIWILGSFGLNYFYFKYLIFLKSFEN